MVVQAVGKWQQAIGNAVAFARLAHCQFATATPLLLFANAFCLLTVTKQKPPGMAERSSSAHRFIRTRRTRLPPGVAGRRSRRDWRARSIHRLKMISTNSRLSMNLSN
jgi:hypothetical protein